jgi:sugar lactone lactonase YvrE
VARHRITHPVINDAALVLWGAYGVRAWPTFILIDPQGHVALHAAGEGHGGRLEEAIRWLIRYHEGRGTLSRRRVAALQPPPVLPTGPLRFPGKVLAGPDALLIADSAHHQIVVADPAGRIRLRIGQGQPGLRDGRFEEARFTHPQGLWRDGERVFVADTGNHAIRELQLAAHTVRTIAGTGQQGPPLQEAAPAPTTPLNSPWDVVMVDETLYIAMAGAHQIWSLDVSRRLLNRIAGTGEEALRDGPAGAAALAQPSGLTADPDGNLYIADSEASAIRKWTRRTDRLDTLIGAGLFEYGDQDGPWAAARLQHPLGILWHDGGLYVADTYNHKVKRLDLAARTIHTVAGTGAPGASEGRFGRFAEPSGVSIAEGRLYVADTNNHTIRAFALESAELSTVALHQEGNANPQ